MIRYFDSHAHLCDEKLNNIADALATRALGQNVCRILNICTNVESLKRGLELRKKYPWIFVSASTTPHDAEKEGECVFPLIEEYALQGNLNAIGETGLDYYYYQETKQAQKTLLRKYLRLALKCKLPVVIHCRDAFADFFEILDEEYVVQGQHVPGVLHCFTGTSEEAKQVIQRGWFLSLSGILTFKKSQDLREIARWVPLDQLLVETDSPFLAPQKQRGAFNEPSFLPEIVAAIAAVKGISVEQVAEVTYHNACRFLHLEFD